VKEPPLARRWCRALVAAPVLVAIMGAWPALQATASGAPKAAPAPADAVDVQHTWLADCAVCHGVDGSGTNRGPSLTHIGAAAIDYQLTTGRMPLPATAGPDVQTHRRPPKYSPPTVRQLVVYVDQLTGDRGVPIPRVDLAGANLAEGGDLFRLQCAACHAWAGDGGALLRREAPALHHDTPVQVAEAVRVGPGVMPAFGRAALDDPQLASVVAYVRYLAKPNDRGGEPLWHLGPMAEGAVAWTIGLGLLILATLWIGEREPVE
jgi:ubiquinol-cytochrome c reductase cytochrome c subunit